MIKRLRLRFIRFATLAATAVLLVLGLILNLANYISVNNELNQMLDAICENQGRAPSAPPGGHPSGDRGGQFTMETPYTTRYFVLRYTENGELDRAELDNIASVTEEDVESYLQIARQHGVGRGYTKGFKYLVVSTGGSRRMAVFLDCYDKTRSLTGIALLTVAAIAVCVVLVLAVVSLFSRRAIDPVVKSIEQQKQFITDAGHELKTPITVISTSLKVLEMETGKQKWIDKAQAQTEKLTELVNALVTLSRMDEEESPLRMRPFAVSEAVGETAESFRDFAATRGHALTVEVTPGLEYTGDEYAVRQLVSILLDNAVKYADPDTPIQLSLTAAKKGVQLRTVNACANVEPDKLPRLFDRFYRAEDSRTSGGFGIGLAIARSIAEGHHGSIRAGLTADGQVEFAAELK